MGTATRRTREQQAAVDEIAELLMGPDGKRLARMALTRFGRHLDAEELVSEAMVAVIVAIDKGTEILEPSGYVFRVMRNLLIKASGGQTIEFDDELAVENPNDPRGEKANEVDQETIDEAFDEIRVQLESSGAPAPQVSAALAKLALGDAPTIPLDDLPSPIAGAAPDEAQWWPCAFLATLDLGMFPTNGRAGQSARKRRSRFIASTRKLLERLMAGSSQTGAQQ